jgi:hypothetical protein
MQCPDCGYEADEASIFCPQCRFQFRDIIEVPAQTGDTFIDLPERGTIADDDIFEEPSPAGTQTAFTAKEIRQMEVQLIQPAILIVLIISLVVYSLIGSIPFIPVTIAGLDFGIAGIICLACGLFSGIVFFFLVRRSLVKFRYG